MSGSTGEDGEDGHSPGSPGLEIAVLDWVPLMLSVVILQVQRDKTGATKHTVRCEKLLLVGSRLSTGLEHPAAGLGCTVSHSGTGDKVTWCWFVAQFRLSLLARK